MAAAERPVALASYPRPRARPGASLGSHSSMACLCCLRPCNCKAQETPLCAVLASGLQALLSAQALALMRHLLGAAETETGCAAQVALLHVPSSMLLAGDLFYNLATGGAGPVPTRLPPGVSRPATSPSSCCQPWPCCTSEGRARAAQADACTLASLPACVPAAFQAAAQRACTSCGAGVKLLLTDGAAHRLQCTQPAGGPVSATNSRAELRARLVLPRCWGRPLRCRLQGLCRQPDQGQLSGAF